MTDRGPDAQDPTARPTAVTQAQAMEALRRVEDPELRFSIVDLGLVRALQVAPDGRAIRVWMTLTSPMCPLGPEIIAAVKAALSALPGVEEAAVELVWSPPWDPATDASDEVKAQLDIWY